MNTKEIRALARSANTSYTDALTMYGQAVQIAVDFFRKNKDTVERDHEDYIMLTLRGLLGLKESVKIDTGVDEFLNSDVPAERFIREALAEE